MQLNETTNLTDYIAAGGHPDSEVNQRIRRRLVEREVLHCISSTVSHFSQNPDACCGDIGYDDVLNLCVGKDWESPGQQRVDDMDRSELLDALESRGVDLPGVDEDNEDEDADQGGELTDKELREMLVDDIDEDWQAFCEEERIDADDFEAYEHWAVTTWLCRKLAECGEITGDLLDFEVWGRTCTGQAIALDHVIASIAAEMGILSGQRNEWSD